MPAQPHDAIALIVDTGKSVAALNSWEDRTFFEKSKECVSWIIQRKLISESQDVLAMLLIGSDEANESWAVSGYKNISCKFDFQFATWEMLKFVETDMRTTEKESDWIGALVVSMEMLKVYEEFNNVENKKIVFFSDFTHPVSDDLDKLIKNLESSKIGITIIGPENILDLVESHLEDEPVSKRKKSNYHERSQERQEGEELVYEFWRKAALKQLCSYTRRLSRKTPWNCILDIGDVKINISMFKKTDPTSSKKFVTKYVKPGDSEGGVSDTAMTQVSSSDTVPVVRDKVMHYKHETKDGEFVDVEVSADETIEGFRYGVNVVPFSDVDKTAMEYKPGPKSFSVIGFTNISSVPFYLLSGECSYLVLPREKDENAAVALSAIIQAMKKMECLAIVRKVYSNDRGLSLGILYPFIEEIVSDETDDVLCKECLLFIELAFEEEVKSIAFPSLETVAKGITQDQYDAVDSLIDQMDLMQAGRGLRGEPSEAFDSSSLHDFKEQFYHYCVIQRGLHPEKPLPTTLPKYIEDYVKVPDSIRSQIGDSLKRISENFKVTIVKPAERPAQKSRSSDPTDDDDKALMDLDLEEKCHFTKTAIDEVENSFKRRLMVLFSDKFPTDDEMDGFLQTSPKGLEMSGKSHDVLQAFREVISDVRGMYLRKNPDEFNTWMTKFKSITQERPGLHSDVWNLVVEGEMGLISERENKFSRVEEIEAEDFLRSSLTQPPPVNTPEVKKPDFGILPDEIASLEEEQMAVGSLF